MVGQITMSVEHETAILVEKFARLNNITCDVAASFFAFVGVSTLKGSYDHFDVKQALRSFLAGDRCIHPNT